MTEPLSDTRLTEIRAEFGPGDWPGEIQRLRGLVAEMTRCRDNALAALYRDDVETDPHLPSVAADAITGMNFDWDDDRVVQDIADTVARALQPAFGKLTQERDSLRAATPLRLDRDDLTELALILTADRYRMDRGDGVVPQPRWATNVRITGAVHAALDTTPTT